MADFIYLIGVRFVMGEFLCLSEEVCDTFFFFNA